MMLILGILILLGVVLDIIVGAWMGLHMILIACGLLLIILNLAGDRLSLGKAGIGRILGKNILSLLVLAASALFLFGFFSSGGIITGKDDPKAVLRKADKIFQSEGAEKALAYIEKETEGLEWERARAYKTAELLEAAGRTPEAKSKFGEIFYYMPLDIEARLRYAAIALEEKNYNEAVQQLLYNTKIDPFNSQSYVLLGDIYEEMGDHIRGIYYYKLAVNEAPGSIENRVKLAQAYADMHSYMEADIEYKKALETASGFEEELMVYNGYRRMNEQKAQESAEDRNQ